MGSEKRGKVILIFIPLLFIICLYLRDDVCYFESYYLSATVAAVVLSVLCIRLKYSKWFTRFYLLGINSMWIFLSVGAYGYFTQFVQHYRPCTWIFKFFFE